MPFIFIFSLYYQSRDTPRDEADPSSGLGTVSVTLRAHAYINQLSLPYIDNRGQVACTKIFNSVCIFFLVSFFGPEEVFWVLKIVQIQHGCK